MPPRQPAHLMLPSPLGLLEYDVLEDAVFLGPGRKGGLRAAPSPFRGATVALTRKADGFLARPLPGETPPEVNGEPLTERALEDGDRIRIGELVALFRTGRGPVRAAPAAPPPAPAGERQRRSSAAPRRDPVATAITLLGLVLILAATYRAVNHLKAIQGAQVDAGRLPELEEPEAARPARALRELLALQADALRTPGKHEQLIQRFRTFQRRHEGTEEAQVAAQRVRELMQAWSVEARAALDRKVASLQAAQQYARALQEIRDFEQRFGMLPAAEGLDAVRRSVREAAEASLEQLIARVSPLITPQPREAHRLLIGVSHEYPADMTARVVSLLERCVARMVAIGEERRERRPPPDRPAKGGDPALPPLPPPDGSRPPPKEPDGPPAEDDDLRERACLDAWRAARTELMAGNYPQALQSYTLLMQQFGNTSAYRTHKAKIAAGRRAARVGALGPAGLVSVPSEVKRGRLEMEYEFNDASVLEEDWTIEQPFSSEMPVEARWTRGQVLMEKASGLLHRIVFLPDVRIEATVSVQMPHDFGMLCVQESDDFRAILFNVANTRFKLKKGDDARVNKGHVLWYIGQGVWSAADADAHGFIKIAERASVKLEGGDRLKMEFLRRKDTAEGSFQGKTDGVRLEGRVKGDDGSTMGPGRVGLFTNSGIIAVESVRISGVVDMEWFRKELSFLVAADPGPPEGE